MDCRGSFYCHSVLATCPGNSRIRMSVSVVAAAACFLGLFDANTRARLRESASIFIHL